MESWSIMKSRDRGGLCLWCLSWAIALAAFAAGSLAAETPRTQTDDAAFVEARNLFWSGRYNESEVKFKLYLAEHPDHQASLNFVKMIGQQMKYNPNQIEATRKHLEQIRVEKIEFKDADFRTVMKYLHQLANPGKETGKEKADPTAKEKTGEKPKTAEKESATPKGHVNFIDLLPPRYERKITLELRDVPLMDAIRYATQQAEVRHVVDTWAVIFELPEGKK